MACTILIIDDDKDLLELYSAVFTSKEYSVVTCSDKDEARKVAQEAEPDCIILDMCIPSEEDGIELAKFFKSNPNTQHTPIVFITAETDVSKHIDAYRAGCLDVITKPFKILDIIKRTDPAVKLGRAYKVAARMLDKFTT